MMSHPCGCVVETLNLLKFFLIPIQSHPVRVKNVQTTNQLMKSRRVAPVRAETYLFQISQCCLGKGRAPAVRGLKLILSD